MKHVCRANNLRVTSVSRQPGPCSRAWLSPLAGGTDPYALTSGMKIRGDNARSGVLLHSQEHEMRAPIALACINHTHCPMSRRVWGFTGIVFWGRGDRSPVPAPVWFPPWSTARRARDGGKAIFMVVSHGTLSHAKPRTTRRMTRGGGAMSFPATRTSTWGDAAAPETKIR